METAKLKFRGYGEVYDYVVKNNISIDARQALKDQVEYISVQKELQQILNKNKDFKDEMPPCCDCPPVCFAFCMDYETECKTFVKYTQKGKR